MPQGAADGEELSPTQPFPTRPAPLHPATLEPEDAWGLTPWDRGRCADRIRALRSDGIFTPPSEQGIVLYPSYFGGINWAWEDGEPEGYVFSSLPIVGAGRGAVRNEKRAAARRAATEA